MVSIKCNTVWIKFVNRNECQQEIRSLQVTGSKALLVKRDRLFLVIEHIDVNGNPIKQLNFLNADIKEYVCEGIYPEPVYVPVGHFVEVGQKL